MKTRTELLAQIKENPQIPVLIIGAGINGIGTFRDLAAQGIDALIVDKDDFCSGASAASSHMLHGGIRYLENGEFRLVREALTERNLMLRNAPHYAKPLPTTVPVFKYFSGLLNAPLKFLGLMDKPAERGALVIKIGMMVYDAFAAKYRVMPTHTFQGRTKSLAKYPKLNPNIRFTGSYYDSWMPSPERICMDLLRDAAALHDGALAINYMSAADGEGSTVTLRDEITGDEYVIEPQVVVNAGGPWIDFVNKAMGEPTNFIGGTKGSHLILDNPDLYEALNGHEFFFENEDGRIVLLLPYMGKVMAGTTDIRIDDPDEAVTTEAEIDYILGMIPHVFPTIPVDRSQIVFHFSGVRPLPSSDSSYTGNVSRDHSLRTVEPDESGFTYPVHSLIGGKWTSFRAFSEETADTVMENLGLERKQSTSHMPIGGGKNYPQDEAAKESFIEQLALIGEIDKEHAQTLFERYGTHAEEVARYLAQDADAPLANHPEYTKREIMYLIRTEGVTRLPDLVLRRTLMAWLGEVNDGLLVELADIAAAELGWSAERRDEEISRAIELLNARYGGKLAQSSAAAAS
jgi:glycerol-3-phosphate dehydrogenase